MIPFLCHSMMQNMNQLIFNYLLYGPLDKWSGIDRSHFWIARQLFVLDTLLDSDTRVVSRVWERSSHIEPVRVGEDEKYVIKPDSHVVVLSSDRNHSLLFLTEE